MYSCLGWKRSFLGLKRRNATSIRSIMNIYLIMNNMRAKLLSASYNLAKHGTSAILNCKLKNVWQAEFKSVYFSYFSASSANKMVSRVSLGGVIGGPATAPAPTCSGLLASGVSDPFPASEGLDKVLSALPSPGNERRDSLKIIHTLGIIYQYASKCF